MKVAHSAHNACRLGSIPSATTNLKEEDEIMNIYFAIYFGLHALSLGVMLAKHGEVRQVNFLCGLCGVFISWVLLYMAGAFDGILQ